MRYVDRAGAGHRLAAALRQEVGDRADVLVLGLPRGGVPVAAEIARELGAELDIFCVRKVGVPWHRELAMGAVASGSPPGLRSAPHGVLVRNESVIRSAGVSPEEFDSAVEQELAEVADVEKRLRNGRPAPALTGRAVVLVDDGLATGASARAALQAARQHEPALLVLAVPVAPSEGLSDLDADRIVCPLTPRGFGAVGAYYDDFRQVSDDEVRAVLNSSWRKR